MAWCQRCTRRAAGAPTLGLPLYRASGAICALAPLITSARHRRCRLQRILALVQVEILKDLLLNLKPSRGTALRARFVHFGGSSLICLAIWGESPHRSKRQSSRVWGGSPRYRYEFGSETRASMKLGGAVEGAEAVSGPASNSKAIGYKCELDGIETGVGLES